MNRRRLQRMIDRTAKYYSLAFRCQSLLDEFCQEEYGKTPSDVDADDIIDSVLGGCGECTGMPADEFDATMRRLTDER